MTGALVWSLIGAGFLCVFIGWGFFRKPGVGFWAHFRSLSWRSHYRKLTPVGFALQVLGTILIVAGLLVSVVRRHGSP